MNRLAKAVEACLLVAIAANAAGLACYLWLRPRSGLYRVGERFPLPAGYLKSGRWLAPSPRRCYLLRVTARGCEYCSQDRPLYRQLASEARASGCEALQLVPKPAWAGPPGGTLQLAYIDLPLARALIPYVTPQTILLGSDGALVWYREGAMDPRSLRSGLLALRKLP